MKKIDCRAIPKKKRTKEARKLSPPARKIMLFTHETNQYHSAVSIVSDHFRTTCRGGAELYRIVGVEHIVHSWVTSFYQSH